MNRNILALSATCGFAVTSAIAQPLASGSYTTPAAQSEMPGICNGTIPFPNLSPLSVLKPLPASATSGTPGIDQIRGGQVVGGRVVGGRVVATWHQVSNSAGCQLVPDAQGLLYVTPEDTASNPLCGPFNRVPNFRFSEPGDIFFWHTAIYEGDAMQPWIGQVFDSPAAYNAGDPSYPLADISNVGQVANGQQPVIVLNTGASNNTLGQAPVYFDQNTNAYWSHIDVVAQNGANVGKSGVYLDNVNGMIFQDSRVTGFEVANANGFFGTANTTGNITLLNDEFSFDGGYGGYAHNVYMSGYLEHVILRHSWSHDAFQGHLFKTRAQVNDIESNYLQGGVPQGGLYYQAESYDLDVSNGGLTTIKDNLFFKTMSGAGTAQASICWQCEGNPDGRAQSVTVQNNTFVAGALTEDGNYQLFPVSYLYPQVTPGGAGWPGYPHEVLNNNYVSYCLTGNVPVDYRGDVWVNSVSSDLSSDYGLSNPIYSDDAAIKSRYPGYRGITGAPSYVHQLAGTPRQTNAIGAKDN